MNPEHPHIPRYEIKRILGRGGMGVVYLAHDTRLGRDVALKMLAGGTAASPEILARFNGEAEAVAQLQHAGIAQIFDVGETDGSPYFTMEYLSGGTLADRIDHVPQSPHEAAKTVETLARAIHASHAHGILHRDLKPTNVLIGDAGALKITDFGLAKFMQRDQSATRTGEVMGTPSYMAPEQASGVVRKLGPACDVYALGAILYELVTGRPPFQSPDSLQTLLMVISEEPVPPRRLQSKLPRDLETICLKCLSKSPGKRYSSALELADDLERFRQGMPILARPVPWWDRMIRFSRRRPAAAALIAVVLIALTIIMGGGAWYNARLRAELNRSQELFDQGRDLAHWMVFNHSEELGRLQGSTRPQEQFVDKMIQYLDGMSQVAVDDEALLQEIAMAYRRVAEVQGDPNSSNLGRSEEALASYRRAIAIYDRMLANSPNSALLRRERALCQASMASIQAVLGQRKEASKHMDQVLADMRALHDAPTHDVPMRQALLLALQQRGSLAWEAGEWDKALEMHHEALTIAENIAQEEPHNPHAEKLVAMAHSHVGRTLEKAGNYAEAKKHYQQTLARIEHVVPEYPDDVRMLRDFSVALLQFGDILSREGNDAEARDSYNRAIKLRRKQATLDPHSATVQRDLAVALERLARYFEQQKEYDQMAEPITESLAITQRLADADPENRQHQRDLWIKRATLGRALMYLQKFEPAAAEMKKARQIAMELASEDDQDTVDLQGVAETTASLGDITFGAIGTASSLAEALELAEESAHFYQAGLHTYQKLEERHPLSPPQLSLRAAINKRLEITQAALQKLQESRQTATDPETDVPMARQNSATTGRASADNDNGTNRPD